MTGKPSEKWRPMTRQEWEADRARREELLQSTEAAIRAGLEAANAGKDIAEAMQRANETIQPGRGPALHAPDTDMPLDAHPRLSGDGWTAEKQQAFLHHLAQTGCVGQACLHVGLSRQSAYKLRQRAPNSVFALGWNVAIHIARQAMLDEAVERALQGREVPIWYHGEQVGTRIVHNDRLLMFLLARKVDPLHAALDVKEMEHLFPAMLKMVDVILPPPFSRERVAELAEDESGDGDASG